MSILDDSIVITDERGSIVLVIIDWKDRGSVATN